MPDAADLEKLPPAARRILAPDTPLAQKTMAARGVVPGLKPGELVLVLSLLTIGDDADIAAIAAGTLCKLPSPVLTGALAVDLEPLAVERLASAYSGDPAVVEKLLRMPRITGEALEGLAGRADEQIGELIATNEQRMLQFPRVIEKLYMNKRVRMSTSDRLLELAVRNGVTLNIPAFAEASQAILNELIPEASKERTFDDVLFQETEVIAEKLALDPEEDDTHDEDEEGQEKVKDKFLPLHAQIAQMTITQKIRRATLGTSAERMMLVRDSNRLVAQAAVRSPMMRENEAARISASRSVSEEVLRIIAMNREFTRNYQVKLNLVMNPRTPFTFASRMVGHLRDNDLRTLSKSKNVTGAIGGAVRQQLSRKQR